ncbi:PREDICTED: uncharacterized protein LOC104816625 [Tarenaya hassleriana]|uniref:uncharacterized protein LOC104816625 n=1 Tax=Tarenaya hassleriana TaxID=28532 RepID=UPI00053C1243|nr:PREDICTED: uncharacterized protein LOC104816625 [Tarenaya hassleriana]
MSTTLRFDTKQMPSPIRTTTDTPSSSPSLSRRQPLLKRSLSMPTTPRASSCTGGATAAEFCGGTTASCAAVWCCCPCGLGKLLVLAVYKVPAGLCRRALRHRRRKRLVKSGLLPPQHPPSLPETDRRGRNRFGSSEFAVHPLESRDVSDEDDEDDFLELKVFGKSSMATLLAAEAAEEEEDAAVMALEKEMWNRFYGAGFWRSPSQRETVPSPRSSMKAVLPSPRPSFTGGYWNMTVGDHGATAETPRGIRQ